MTDDSFADVPISIGELRAEASETCRAWTPRDALIQILRMIDKGEETPTRMVICWGKPSEGSKFLCAADDYMAAMGMVVRTLHRMNTDD